MNRFFDNVSFYYRIVSTVIRNGFYYGIIDPSYIKFIKNTATELVATDVLFVKIIQALANCHELLDEDTGNELMMYTDRVPYTHDDYDTEIINHIIDNTPFMFVDDQPIRAGMISLVFMMIHEETNELYVLKMKRRLIKQRLYESSNRMRSMLSIISSVVFWWCKIDISDTVDKHLRVLESQLDFKQEIENTRTFYRNFQNIDYVKIPNVLHEESPYNDDYIIMEYIEGASFSNLSEKLYITYAKMVTKMGITCVLINGFAHGDLHAGNLLFIENSDEKCQIENVPKFQIGVIDFGLVIKISQKIIDALQFASMNYRRPGRMVEIAKMYLSVALDPANFLETISSDDSDFIVNEVACLMMDTMCANKSLSQAKIYQSFQIVNNYIHDVLASNNKIKLDCEFASMQVALSMANGVTMQLCENDFNQQISDAIDELFHTDLFGSDSDEDGEYMSCVTIT